MTDLQEPTPAQHLAAAQHQQPAAVQVAEVVATIVQAAVVVVAEQAEINFFQFTRFD